MKCSIANRAVWWLCAVPLWAQIPAPLPGLERPAVAKNFYFLTEMERDPATRQQVMADDALRRLAGEKKAALAKAAATCGNDPACHFTAARFRDDEVTLVAARLQELASRPSPLQKLISGPLRASGAFVRYHRQSDAELAGTAWRDAARGLDRLIAVYGEGKPPRYPAIDSISFPPADERFKRLVNALTGAVETTLAPEELFFTPALRFATELMLLSRRDEAGRHEPLEQGENRAAWQAARTTRWSDYPYTAIVVPGAGGDNLTTRLSPGGRLRTMIAAARWKAKQAPFVLVSGGYVHPNQTPFAEAMEMKRALVSEFGVPESAVIIDPHARHTTTNLRNAARLLFRYGIPLDRPAVITTDPGQSAYIENVLFAERCRNELGYVPYRLGKRLSRFDQEVTLLIESLQLDNADPLDP
jgi:hypothetical protein